MSARTERILVVDDQTYFRTMVIEQLRRLGFQEILQADSGMDALSQMANARPDLILLDINMKPMDGLEFLARVRANATLKNRDVPVIFLTSHAESDKVRRAIELGAAGYLVKPIAFLDLQARIASALGRKAKGG